MTLMHQIGVMKVALRSSAIYRLGNVAPIEGLKDVIGMKNRRSFGSRPPSQRQEQGGGANFRVEIESKGRMI